MDCGRVDEQIIAYHFATASEEEREAIDAHLVTCTRCLRAYLALKHHTDRQSASAPRPSETMKARLRAEVAATFRPTIKTRTQRFFARPIPLYQGIAVAAAAVLIASIAPTVARNAATSRELAPTALGPIDTARPKPESLKFY